MHPKPRCAKCGGAYRVNRRDRRSVPRATVDWAACGNCMPIPTDCANWLQAVAAAEAEAGGASGTQVTDR